MTNLGNRRATYNVCSNAESQMSVCEMSVKSTHLTLIPMTGCSKKSYTVWVENASVCSAAGHSVYWVLAVIN